MARLADGGQLLAVTHSPQVAARGHAHWKVRKAEADGLTTTTVVALDEEHRREEIARMLSGAEVTDEARAQGLSAQVVAEDGWPAALAGARLVHVHAGIGWEGHGLTHAAAEAGAAVVRTEHLPWLLTDAGQIADYAEAVRRVDAVIAVSRAAAAGWRRALSGMSGPPCPSP